MIELGRGLVSRLVVSRRLFYRRQVVAFSSADLGGAVALFPAAVVGGVEQVSLNNFYGLPWNLIFQGAWNTVMLMVTVPTLTLFFCLAISWTVLRSGLRWRLLLMPWRFCRTPCRI